MNTQIFTYLYGLSNISQIGYGSYLLSYPVAYAAVIILMISAIFFSSKKMFNFSLLFLSGVSAWVLAGILKIIFHTARPYVAMNMAPLFHETSFSFPSEHAALFAALASALFLINRRIAIFFSVLALLIGISRVVIGVHYPVDVLGGFIIGIIVGYLYTKLFKKL